MRAMVVGPLGRDSFADNVVFALRAMGHTVYPVGGARVRVGNRRLSGLIEVLGDHGLKVDRTWQVRFTRILESERPDILISVDRRLGWEVLDVARRLSVPTALWFPDSVASLKRGDVLLAGYDRYYFKNPDLVRRLAAMQGLPVRYLPEAANVHWHRPVGDYGVSGKVVMAGNIHPARALLLSHLQSQGVDVSIYGAPVPSWVRMPDLEKLHTGEYLEGQRKSQIMREGVAVLNNLHPAEYAGVNCRLFEAAAAGAVVLMEDSLGLADLFDIGSEVLTYDSREELVRKIRWLADNPDIGLAIGDAAARRAVREHSYQDRLKLILEDLL